MKIKSIFLLITLNLFLNACGQGKIETPKNAMNKFTEFHNKEKFLEDTNSFYTGIGNPKLLPILNQKINEACEDFKNVAQKQNPTDKDYQEKIKIGLERFSDIYLELDTEDRERICNYFEELMDIVGLESSGGHLNNFMYGFDPTKIKKKEERNMSEAIKFKCSNCGEIHKEWPALTSNSPDHYNYLSDADKKNIAYLDDDFCNA